METISQQSALRLSKPSEIPDLKNQVVFLDTESTGLDRFRDKPFMVQIGIGRKNFLLRWDDHTVNYLNDNFASAKLVVGHNFKHDIHQLINGGVREDVVYAPPMFDTMLSDALCFEHHRQYSMDACAERFSFELRNMGITPSKYPIEEVIAKLHMVDPSPKLKAHLHKLPIEMVLPYANQDLNIGRGLYALLSRDLVRQSLDRIAKVEFECLKVLCRMERRGAPIDWASQHEAWLMCNEFYAEMDDQLTAIVGYRTNPDSQPELKRAFNWLGLPVMESFDKEHLGQVKHPVAKHILEMRSLKKIIQTFVDGARKYCADDDAIHTNYNQLRGDNEYGVKTGRISSSGPNMQQIPMRNGKWAKAIRHMFAKKGLDWSSGDWSQFEYRIFADRSEDEGVLKKYRDDPNTDFHQAVADIAKIDRSKAKRVNLGLVFSMGEGKMAKEMGLPYETYIDKRSGQERFSAGPEAKAIFASYHHNIPGARRFLTQQSALAEKVGYVTTVLGRRIRFPDGKTHKAGGLVFQGSAADLMKKKLIELDRELMTHHKGSELILVVHDEFNVLHPPEDKDKVTKTMKEIMEDVPELKVPVVAEIGTGHSWWNACE